MRTPILFILLPCYFCLTVNVVVDSKGLRMPVNPEIYGVNLYAFPNYAQNKIPFPATRIGGDAESCYNYKADAGNAGADWYFLTEGLGDGTNLPNNNTQQQQVTLALAQNANVMVTVPMLGWVAASRTKAPSFRVDIYGAQQCTEADASAAQNQTWGDPNAGNGRVSTGACNLYNQGGNWITNQVAANWSQIPVDASWIQSWIQNLQSVQGKGRVKYFSLDNEVMLWSNTHHDAHPTPTSYDDIWNRTVYYGTVVKQTEPEAKLFGPVTWGYCDLYWSEVDGCNDGNNPDRAAHGNVHFLEWYIQQIARYYNSTGVKLVDYIDLHWYPQGSDSSGGIYGPDGDANLQALRLRSIKELYNASYAPPESWIADVNKSAIQLIPLVKAWIVNTKGAEWLKISMTEFNWGSGYTGSLAIAEVLSIFAQQGVELATQWGYTDNGNRGGDAYKLYLNYNGAGARVNGDNIPATSSSFDDVGSYAYHNANTNALYIALFNKNTGAVTVTGQILAFSKQQTALHYYFDASSPLTSTTSVSIAANGSFTVDLGARSAHLLVTSF